MRKKAYAKINIALDVIGKREDGYHLLKMVMQTIDLYDEIEVKKNHLKTIKLNCNRKYIPTDDRNLAFKAAKLFKEHFNIQEGVDIYIKKNIPVSAGMAGGSTNAAAVLYLMNKEFNVNASIEELRELGVKIGADVPYCIEGGTALCEGIGEVITNLKPFKDKILVIVKPPFGVSTKEVYGTLDINKIFKHVRVDDLISAMEREDLVFVAENMKNILENVTLRKHNVLRNIKDEMIECGAMGSMMSGSGPTVFAFFEDMPKAQRCYDVMKKKYKDVFITRTI
ncbi:4-diphosphocytidyl-2-C-methyl-D-erythritol kinase [Clostridium cavendishii DSM 21758]|uniref:4-diphosphocytidyl-2-C-methyl-D-erythritol kinase n=1 Tax=Clostridium cavendishii DSM 21758 TaxID=1121302 RepID=A0A1M6U6C3_9CLOT|nr:4-(cytidine 5'-diphospho)-2-C-methyl-D-erythritol kinase [Clostridium cavendishii]SHK64701.1 4-diphosphocytidyl-2-C-methyl-D-erythritol kinase [Clostridium cavendishii DSM 21758]